MTQRRRRRNGFLSDVFGTRVTVYKPQRNKRASAPSGVETRYMGYVIRRTSAGDFATNLDWDSRFESMQQAKMFIRTFAKRMSNPRGVKARVRRLPNGKLHVHVVAMGRG